MKPSVRGARVHSLTIYLLKPEVDRPERALRDPGALSPHEIEGPDASPIGRFYFKAQTAKPPRLMSLFGPSLSPAAPPLRTLGVQGVALIPCAGRMFAVTLGSGRHLLAPGACEERFGLITTLNSIPRNGLRSIDRQRFDAISSHSRTQASRQGDFADFGIDAEQDLLRAVTGTPTDKTLGKRLAGMDALHATVELELTDVVPLLGRYHKKFNEETYKSEFGWVDQLAEVRDKSQIDTLNEQVVWRLRGRAPTERLWLAVPQIIEWKDVEGFRYSRESEDVELHNDLHVADFLATLRDPSGLDLKTLRKQYVRCEFSASGMPLEEWPVYACLYGEVDSGGQTFVLSAGKWYAIERDFVRAVNAEVRALANGSVVLPDYHDASETAYNIRVAANDSRFALMDRVMIPYGGGRSSIEFCDLFGIDGKLIHVKNYAGSAPLSHLFSQGDVSAELFIVEAPFRDDVRGKLPSSHRPLIPTDTPSAGQYEVVFAIISRSQKDIADSLPFFSRLNLRNRARALRAKGFKVSLVKVAASASQASARRAA